MNKRHLQKIILIVAVLTLTVVTAGKSQRLSSTKSAARSSLLQEMIIVGIPTALNFTIRERLISP